MTILLRDYADRRRFSAASLERQRRGFAAMVDDARRRGVKRGNQASQRHSKLPFCVDCRRLRKEGDLLDDAQRVEPGSDRCLRHAVEHAGAAMRERLAPLYRKAGAA